MPTERRNLYVYLKFLLITMISVKKLKEWSYAESSSLANILMGDILNSTGKASSWGGQVTNLDLMHIISELLPINTYEVKKCSKVAFKVNYIRNE